MYGLLGLNIRMIGFWQTGSCGDTNRLFVGKVVFGLFSEMIADDIV
jgi:hypothetical protein